MIATVYCTGISAAWCPICGDCECPTAANDERLNLNHPTCPLHGTDSKHADTKPPTLDELLEVQLDRADDRAVYPLYLRQRIANALPKLKIAGPWRSWNSDGLVVWARTDISAGGGVEAAGLHPTLEGTWWPTVQGRNDLYGSRDAPIEEWMPKVDAMLIEDGWVLCPQPKVKP